MLTPTDLLFAADRALRDAASSYDSAARGTSEDMLRVREDELRQAARDYAWAAGIVDTAVGRVDPSGSPRFHGSNDIIERITAPTAAPVAAPATEPAP